MDKVLFIPFRRLFYRIKNCFFFALFFAFPLIAIQIWRFIAPGLYKNEKRAFLPYLIATPLLFFAGGSMVYYIISPIAWSFFSILPKYGFIWSTNKIRSENGEYLSLMMRFIFAFGLAFQLPVVLSPMARVGMVTHESLKNLESMQLL